GANLSSPERVKGSNADGGCSSVRGDQQAPQRSVRWLEARHRLFAASIQGREIECLRIVPLQAEPAARTVHHGPGVGIVVKSQQADRLVVQKEAVEGGTWVGQF